MRRREDAAAIIEQRRGELHRVVANSAEAAEILREIGLLLARDGKVRQALDTYSQSLRSSRVAGDHRQSARALEAMGMLHARRGEYETALECYFEALREGIDIDDPRAEAAAWMEIAAVYSENGVLDLALESLERSIGILSSPSDSYLQARARISAASVLVALDRAVESIDHAMRGLIALEAYDDYSGQVDALLVVGRAYRMLGDLASAGGYIGRGAELARARAYAPGIASAMLALAEVRRDERRPADAIAAADEALEVARDGGMLELEWRLHELVSELHEELGNAVRALEHARRFIETRDRSRARVRDARFDELRARHEALTLGRERDELQLETEQLRNDLVEKNRALTSAALSLVQKSELLDEVRVQLGGLVSTTTDYSESIVQPILEEIADGNGDESWSMFELQFNHVHSDFTRRLAEYHPALTPMELKISTLTRIDLSAKEIARLLHVSERNVQNHRYRLRKKLGLTSVENLASFLAAL